MIPPARKPTSVIFAAVLLFVYGGLMLCCSVCGGAEVLVESAHRKAINAEVPGMFAMDVGLAVWNLFIGITVIGLGIGVLALKAIARTGAFVACTAEILLMFVASALQISLVFPAQEKVLKAAPQGGAPVDIVALTQFTSWLVLIVMDLLTLLCCISIVVLLRTRAAQRAFSGEAVSQDDAWTNGDFDEGF